ncbi:hypothetical protein conserved [Leishmania donovani]|uniref:Hypothetical_protein_conserved n=1 Tax=Leishmania donovani TaxID=5661 RepID=A0A504Y196_LEIDO|nr:hypothetical protein CGC20_5585 [Leishmania donovani]CAJ1989821.1 hypothetical protein conserved [Leishmania donovani]VDZ45684.1 hypothetical_protein_conserved [Leishmania donovani]
MMGYEGRCVLLDDADEWVNIPFVVREFMKQLNDEAQASRAVVEMLRQEQKETNLLLRRVMQKQADLEIDNARNIMSLNHHASRVAHDSTEKRHTEQIHSLRKKAEKLDEKMQHLSAHVEELSKSALFSISTGSAFDELKGLVTCLTTKAETTERLLKDHVDACTVGRRSTESLVDSAALAAVTDVQKTLKSELDVYSTQQRSLEKSIGLLREASSSQKEESSRIRGMCEELSQIVEADQKASRERFTSCFNTVEKLECLCVAQHAELELRMKRAEDTCLGSESRSREEAKSLYAELRGLVKEDQAETRQRYHELAEELRTVKEQQRRLTEQLATANHEAEALTQRAVKQMKDISVRLDSVETEVEQLGSTLVARRDHQEQRQTQDALEAIRTSLADTVATFQAQVQQLATSVKTMRAEQMEDNDWLHNELGRIGTMVGYASQQREKQERQVTSLCEIVHNLSVAVEGLQKGCGVTVVPPPAPAASPAQANTPESCTSIEIPAAWETWRSTFVKDVEERITAAVSPNSQPHASPPVLERVSQQLNELTAKVDGGAKYTQAIVSQQMDQMRSTVRDEVTHQLQSHAALREVTPALVEVEAVKRRVAGIELGLQTLSTRADRWCTDTEAGSLSPTNPVLQRVLLVEEAIDGFKRRLLELGEHVMSVDQRSSQLACGAHEMEAQLHDQQRMTLKLGTDLTAALEGLLHTEQSLSRHQNSTTLQLSEVHTQLEKWKRDAAAAPTAAAPSVESPSSVQNGAAAAFGMNADVSRRSLSASVARLTETVDHLSAQVTRIETETLQALHADLEAVRGECAAATARQSRRDGVSSPACDALHREAVRAAYEELHRHLDAEESSRREAAAAALCTVEERLLAIERDVSELLSSPPNRGSPPAGDADSAATAAAVKHCVDELARCHERLDVVQQQLNSNACRCSSGVPRVREVERDAHHQDVHRLQQQLGRLQEDMHAFVTSQLRTEMREAEPALVEAAATAAVLRCQDVLKAAAESSATAVDAHANTESLAALQAAVEEVQHTLEERISTLLEGYDRVESMEKSLRATADDLSALEKAQSELRSELERAQSAHQAHQRDFSLQLETIVSGMETKIDELRANVKGSAVVATTESFEAGDRAQKPSDDTKAAWVAEVVDSMHATYYPRALLEERLENIWSSMIGLLARKEDVSAVHDKLNGLHQLIQEEMQIEVQRLEEELANQLAEKVSLANLQDILEHHIAGSDADSDHAVM